jgi:hypothetical protein
MNQPHLLLSEEGASWHRLRLELGINLLRSFGFVEERQVQILFWQK